MDFRIVFVPFYASRWLYVADVPYPFYIANSDFIDDFISIA